MLHLPSDCLERVYYSVTNLVLKYFLLDDCRVRSQATSILFNSHLQVTKLASCVINASCYCNAAFQFSFSCSKCLGNQNDLKFHITIFLLFFSFRLHVICDFAFYNQGLSLSIFLGAQALVWRVYYLWGITIYFNKPEFIAINTNQKFHMNIEENVKIKHV